MCPDLERDAYVGAKHRVKTRDDLYQEVCSGCLLGHPGATDSEGGEGLQHSLAGWLADQGWCRQGATYARLTLLSINLSDVVPKLFSSPRLWRVHRRLCRVFFIYHEMYTKY